MDCVQQIQDFTGNNLKYVWDTIGGAAAAEICAKVISPGGTYGTILRVDFPRSDVRKTFTVGLTAIGETFELRGKRYEASA